MSETDVEVRRLGNLGHITLNRPKAINALTFGMLRAIDAALSEWEGEPNVRGILIDGAGERGLCAGGDIRWLYDHVTSGHADLAQEFFAYEYAVNARIARTTKPYVAFMDGLVMGGGVGVSAHGSVRITTERTKLAMPEVGIGFLPDVGGTYLLSTAPGELGTHAALTGETMGAADVILCGLADYHVPSDRLPALREALGVSRNAAEIGLCVAEYATPPAPGKLAANRAWIDRCYRHDTVEAVLDALRASPEEAAQAAATRISGNSPLALTVALKALREGRRLGRLEPCLEMEYRLVANLIRHHDFAEGVRAAVVDKDRNPAWAPATLAEVDPALVESFFRSEISLGLPTA